jgi:NADH-quinone oxidoreductase subunit E
LIGLAEKYPQEIQEILSKYPPEQKRSAVMPLLYLAQREQGFVNLAVLNDIAALLDISPTDVASIVGFYTLYHEQPGGKIRIQVCNDLPCALRGADEFLAKLCENLGIQVGETTPDGLVTVEAVMCLAGCDKAPMFQVQSGEGLEYHENQTVESALELVEAWRKKSTEPASEADQQSTRPTDGSVKDQAERGTSLMNQAQRLRLKGQGGGQ